ncbi:ferrous iron transport protein B [uncultured Desulfuromonas sp.]|uniref:ferrous iron transport protein B n=1 Tax=uncultured Desulfuromonas sp. TaxID=181013 RepID=UPI002630919C|nr:ferrous iron transport protein B [uncultured Desulfuromonas sp.]
MSHSSSAPVIQEVEDKKKIVLVGNPNVGKSIFFGTWSGVYVDVSNFPGTTVEITRGRVGEDALFDTPGVYGVSSFNDEERVARDVILSADTVVNVVDATHLERDLFLTLQVIDMGLPTVVALNFCDEAEALGVKIDAGALQEALGVPVIPTTAVDGKGVAEVYSAISLARPGKAHPEIEAEVHKLLDRIDSRPEALMVLEGDWTVAKRHGVEPLAERERVYLLRRHRANEIVAQAVTRPERTSRLRDLIGRLCLDPLTGIPVLLAVLWGCYQLIGVWVAGDVVGLTEETLMQGYWEPWIRGLAGGWVAEGSALGQILIGEFGVLTMTVTYLLGLLLPLVLGFYVALSVLEDSGYLPRLATLVDRMMTSIGLNGRAVIPVILGFGCVQLGTITTRILGSKRERTIATSILNFVVPCSAQIGVIAGMLAVVGMKLTLAYVATIFACLAILGTVLNKMIPGKSSALLIDLPPMRLPRIGNVLRKTGVRTFFFMKEAYVWFIAGSLGVSLLHISGGLKAWQNLVAPLTEGWLSLPKEAATAFVMGMVRRDFGAAGLTELSLAPWQVVVSLVVITLFVPCIASLMILFKERGVKEAMAIWAGAWVLAFTVGGVLAQIVL